MRRERSSLCHQALLYGSPEEFVRAMAPFVRDGLARGDRVFAATKPSNIEALREELGEDADRAEMHDTAGWETRPYGRLQAFKRLAEEVPAGGVLHAMGEPVWEGTAATVRQWARYESIINAALAKAPMRFVCLYDSAALPDRILEYAVTTHPERVVGDEAVACLDFVRPGDFTPGPPPEPPGSSEKLPLAGAEFRRMVRDRALAAGLEGERVEGFVLAAHELAVNATVHGRPPAWAQIWATGDEMICQVMDAGAGIADPLAGWLPAPVSESGGLGLPIARQLGDALEVGRRNGTTVVSLHFSL
jgi:anti-sigma regulatory factor (Ser/Thr protein kinase)